MRSQEKSITEQFDGGYLRVSEAAKLLHFSVSKIYKLIGSGAIKSRKFGGSRRISVNELKEYVDNAK